MKRRMLFTYGRIRGTGPFGIPGLFLHTPLVGVLLFSSRTGMSADIDEYRRLQVFLSSFHGYLFFLNGGKKRGICLANENGGSNRGGLRGAGTLSIFFSF